MELELKKENEIAILTIKGNLLGENDAKPISEMVNECFDENINFLIFDLKDMKYLNSTGLSILINTMTKSRKNNGELILVNSPKQLLQLLEITKLTNVIPQCDTVETALKQLKSGNS